MKDENVVYVDFTGKEIADYVARGEHASAGRGKLCSETLGNAVVGIFGSKGAGLANINNVSELEGLLNLVEGSAKIVGPEKCTEEARKYLVKKGIKIDEVFPAEGYVTLDVKTGIIEVDEPSITYLTKRPGSAHYLN
jgi:hypothetical protein